MTSGTVCELSSHYSPQLVSHLPLSLCPSSLLPSLSLSSLSSSHSQSVQYFVFASLVAFYHESRRHFIEFSPSFPFANFHSHYRTPFLPSPPSSNDYCTLIAYQILSCCHVSSTSSSRLPSPPPSPSLSLRPLSIL